MADSAFPKVTFLIDAAAVIAASGAIWDLSLYSTSVPPGSIFFEGDWDVSDGTAESDDPFFVFNSPWTAFSAGTYTSNPNPVDAGTTRDFALEGSCRLSTVTPKQYLYTNVNGGAAVSLEVYVEAGNLVVAIGGSSVASTAVSVDTRFEWAVSRVSGTRRCWCDGVQFGTSDADTNGYDEASWRIGADDAYGNAIQDGRYYRFRRTIGAGRYTTGYSGTAADPWDAFYKMIGGTLSDQNADPVDGSHTWDLFVLHRASGILWGPYTAASDGTWTAPCKTDEEVDVLFKHYTASTDEPVYNDFVLRVLPDGP